MTTDLNLNIFKANDIRGKYPSEINEKVVSEIARKLGRYFLLNLKPKTHNLKPIIVIAHDIRLSSPSLYKAVIKQLEIENWKLKIVPVGLSTTPMFYFLVKKLKAGGGMMITASHNPPNYNGLKVVDQNALPVSGLRIRELFEPRVAS